MMSSLNNVRPSITIKIQVCNVFILCVWTYELTIFHNILCNRTPDICTANPIFDYSCVKWTFVSFACSRYRCLLNICTCWAYLGEVTLTTWSNRVLLLFKLKLIQWIFTQVILYLRFIVTMTSELNCFKKNSHHMRSLSGSRTWHS